jgi:hypothetical protein
MPLAQLTESDLRNRSKSLGEPGEGKLVGRTIYAGPRDTGRSWLALVEKWEQDKGLER